MLSQADRICSTSQRVKEEEGVKECAFKFCDVSISGEDRKVRSYPGPGCSGHFHVFLTIGAGNKQNRVLICRVCCIRFSFAISVCKSDGNHYKNRQKAMQKNDLLDGIFCSNDAVLRCMLY
jgi:hypothetical protein